MGQKVDPRAFRIGLNGRSWNAVFCEPKWKNYATAAKKDFIVREYLDRKLSAAKISEIKIEKISNNYRVTLHVGKLAALTGKNSTLIEEVKRHIKEVTQADTVILNFIEVKKVDTEVRLIALSIAKQIENRSNPKKAMKKASQIAMKSGGIRGIKVEVSGRIGGAEIARTEKTHIGRIPLHTLSADIDYAHEEAKTVYGIIGIKVWVCKRMKLPV